MCKGGPAGDWDQVPDALLDVSVPRQEKRLKEDETKTSKKLTGT